MASAVAGQWVFGIILALLGQLFGMPAVTQHAGLDLDAQARLLLALFTGQLLFTAGAGRAVDRFAAELEWYAEAMKRQREEKGVPY